MARSDAATAHHDGALVNEFLAAWDGVVSAGEPPAPALLASRHTSIRFDLLAPPRPLLRPRAAPPLRSRRVLVVGTTGPTGSTRPCSAGCRAAC